MEPVCELSLLAGLLTTGLMAFVYLAVTIAVLPGLGRGDDGTLVTAMRGMNAAILNPVLAGGDRLTGLLPEESCRFPSEASLGMWWFH